MYKIYWKSIFGVLWKECREDEVKTFIDALDRLGWPVEKVEML